MADVNESFIGLYKVKWQIFCTLYGFFCTTQEVVENTKFWKKRLVNLSIENKIGLFFSLPNLTPFSELFMMYDGPQGILKFNLPAIRLFFGTKEVVTTKFSQIKGYHPVGKKFLHKFLSFLPIIANIEQQLVRLFKIMWHLWCKLWDYFSTPNRLLKT